MKRISKLILLGLLVVFAKNLIAQTNNLEDNIYLKAGIIKIKDPKAVMVGYKTPDNDVFEINLDDVGKFTGHVCPGVTSGFLLTKKALEALFPNNEIPIRGNISIATASRNDLLEVASYIVRAREKDEEGNGNNSIVIDSTIISEKGTVSLIFKRNDTGKMVKAVFNKAQMMTDEIKNEILPLKKKITEGNATENEKLEFGKKVQKIVKHLIINQPSNVYVIKECNNYKFP